MPKRVPTRVPKEFWDRSGATISYRTDSEGKKILHMKRKNPKDAATILLTELVEDLKFRDAQVFINETRHAPMARELEDIGCNPEIYGLESSKKRQTRKSAKRTEETKKLDGVGVDELVAKLAASTDSDEKKRIRRTLRKLGHSGGAKAKKTKKTKKTKKKKAK